MNWVFSKLLRNKSTNQEIRLGNQNEFSGVISPNKPIAVTNEPVEFTGGVTGIPDSCSYKVYTALLTQSGTNDPVATVLENTLGVTPTLNYEHVAEYSLTITGDLFADTSKVSISFKTDTIYYNGAARPGLFVRVDGYGIDPVNPTIKTTSPNGEVFMYDTLDDPIAVYDPNKTLSNGTWEITDDNTITLFTGVNSNLTNALFEIRVYN